MIVIKDAHKYMTTDVADLQLALNNGGKYTNAAGLTFTIKQMNGRNTFTISQPGEIIQSGEFIQTFWSIRNQYGEVAKFDDPFEAVAYKNRQYRNDLYVTQIWE